MPNQPSLNPDALRVATAAAHDAVDWQMYDVTKFDLEDSVDVATIAAVSAYLAFAQPVVNSVEELDALPQETVIRDRKDFVFERIVQHGKDPEWWSTTDFLNETKVTLPARVLYRPEVDDA